MEGERAGVPEGEPAEHVAEQAAKERSDGAVGAAHTEVLGRGAARGPMDPTLSLGARAAKAIGSTVVASPRPAGTEAAGGGASEASGGASEAGAEGERRRRERAVGAAAMAAATVRFVAQGELGRGGMGRVVLAHDRQLERAVAIKQALSDDAAHRLRFAREVRITARLEHPSIVPVHDAGYDAQGHPYYVMRRLEGRPLEELVRETTSAAARLALVPHVLAVADAAAYAHAQGIIHRDIKPSNILVGRYGETWLIDWGLAREIERAAEAEADTDTDSDPDSDSDSDSDPDSDVAQAATRRVETPRLPADADGALTRLGDVVGTPGFVAPEQARGEPVDVRADVYSLGATLLYALTGQLVYPERTPTRLIERAAAAQPIHLPAQTRELPSALLAIVATATAARASERYRSAAELASDLRRFLTGQLVAAHRYSTGERLRRFVRRHRAALAIAAAAVVALTAIGAISILRILDERDRASAAERDTREQRDLALRRSEQLLLERARVLARTQPTAALATLKLLPADSEVWPAAWGIAAQAMAAGVSFGLAEHHGNARALAFSPDDTRLASGGEDGVLQLHELATRRSAQLVREADTIDELVWLDREHLAYVAGAELVIRSVDGGEVRRWPGAATYLHALRGGGLRYLQGGALYQLDEVASGAIAPRQLVANARAIIASGDGTAVATGAALQWVASDGAIATLAPYEDGFLVGAVSEDARRLAVSTLYEVIEVALPTRGASKQPPTVPGVPTAPNPMAPRGARARLTSNTAWLQPLALRRMPLEGVSALAYSPAGLCILAKRKAWVAPLEIGVQQPFLEEIPYAADLGFAGATPRGCAFIGRSGGAELVQDGRRASVPMRGPATLAAAVSRRGDAFAVLHEGGGLEVWPLPAVPRRIPLELMTFSLVGASDRALYFFQDIDSLLQVSRATGVVRELLERRPPLPGERPPAPWATPLGVSELDDERAMFYSPARCRLAVLDLRRGGVLHQLEGIDATIGVDAGRRGDGDAGARSPAPRRLIARGDELAFFDPVSGQVSPLRRFDAPILSLDQRGDVALVRGATRLWRITLSRGEVRSIDLAAEPPLAIDDAGVAWIAAREGVVRWDGVHARTIAMPAAVNEILAHDWLGVLVLDTTGALHVLDEAGALTRSVAVSPYAQLSRDWPYALWRAPDRAAIILGDLVGGEHIALPFSDATGTAMLADRDGAVVAVSMLDRAALIYPRLLPHDVRELPAWLSRVTNAEITLDSSEPHWNLAPPAAAKGSAAPP